MDTETAEAHLVKLQALLADDDSEAVDCWNQIRPGLRDLIPPSDFVTLDSRIRGFDFGEALEALAQLPGAKSRR